MPPFGFMKKTVSEESGNGLLTDLIHHWSLDETTGDRVDDVGEWDLSETNSVDYTTGLDGNAARFTDGNGEKLEIASLTDSWSALSMSLWWYNSSWAAEKAIFTFGASLFITWTSNNFLIRFPTQTIPSNSEYSDGWNHICCVANGTDQRIFLNGKLIAKTVNSSVPSLSSQSIVLGNQSSRYITADFDDWCIWERALSDGGVTTVGDTAGGDVGALYNSGSGLFYNSFD